MTSKIIEDTVNANVWESRKRVDFLTWQSFSVAIITIAPLKVKYGIGSTSANCKNAAKGWSVIVIVANQFSGCSSNCDCKWVLT
ncbi:hypothetical protein FACS1894125_3090 [Actinomycetota bacterium]|nr:hypothetical protein FACS1894125_3090 [Actinomycetota bacterium]